MRHEIACRRHETCTMRYEICIMRHESESRRHYTMVQHAVQCHLCTHAQAGIVLSTPILQTW